MAHRPLLALVMIVKNEARSIERTIESVKPFVDRWLILDTGSTDGTQGLARSAFEGVPGRLEEGPFVDFGTTRNKALDLLGTETEFSLMLSGDETLAGGEALRAFLDAHRGERDARQGAYYLRIQYGSMSYDSARVARTDATWRYVGSTHEVLMKGGVLPPSHRVPGAHVVHDLVHRDATAERRRWQLDLDLLGAEREARPDDTRVQFYLAQTLECLGEHERALEAYVRRVEMGGWQEEVYESLFRIGRAREAAKKAWPETQQQYLSAHAHSPNRAEPLFAIAMHWYEEKAWPLVYLFARRGAELPYPEGATLFVDAEVYRYKLLDLVSTSAYYVGAFEEGQAALNQALARLGEDLPVERARLLKNLEFYARRGDEP